MKISNTIILIFTSLSLIAQKNQIQQISFNGENYWKYESVDIHNNTPYKFPPSGYGQFPKDGRWISCFEEDTTKVASIFEVRNGKLDGKSIQFRLDESKESEYDFLKGEQNGYERFWNKKGVLVFESQHQYKNFVNFESSVRIGELKKWNDNGKLVKIQRFLDDEPNGRQLEIYENGQIKKEEFYINGKKDSTITKFHSNGQIEKQIKYTQGRFVEENPNVEYHSNGNVAGKGDLKAGQKTGKWIYYYNDGAKESEGKYETYIFNYHNENTYFYHKKGLWNYWYTNGRLKAKGIYGSPKIEDLEFNDQYQNTKGVRKDSWKYFDDNGTEISLKKFNSMMIKMTDY
ncbi:toxin-antitoxin system YwqK family antitoxin [Aquimarina sp. Aq78]|uniref:toxin-antitoxin system YwqK family antitoxin n=1 Tax=Aquimarina sp. Aq78 TaxID=1191889 RepID=UPI000D0EABA7|nr:hypothetical protein [Aquimarina sp. Aq78]